MQYIVADLEATCWEGLSGSPNMEIIEIGAVRLASATGPVEGVFGEFVRPVVDTTLSAFCTRLTSIRQEDVDPAETFPSVFAKYVEWIGAAPFVWGSWGAYDLNQFRRDCQRHQMPLPQTFERHINLKQEFARLKKTKPCGMSQALKKAGLPLEGTHHRALDDAKNIARLALWILPRLEAEGMGLKEA